MVFDLVLARWGSKKVFDYPRVFKRKVISTNVNWFKYKQFFIFNLVLYFIKWLYVFSRLMIHNTSSSPTHTLYFYILLYLLFPHWALFLLTLFYLIPFQVRAGSYSSSWWIWRLYVDFWTLDSKSFRVSNGLLFIMCLFYSRVHIMFFLLILI